MTSTPKIGTLLPVLGLALLSVLPASALTVTQSLTAPFDALLAQPDFSAPAFNGGTDFTDNAGSPGQTFTAPFTLSLEKVTTKGFANTGASFGGSIATGTLTITISQIVAGSQLQVLLQETASASAITDGSAFLTFALSTPVEMQSGVQYAYSIYSSTGYYGFAKSSSDVLAGGFAFQHGSTPRSAVNGATVTNTQGVDRTFYLQGVPEPGSSALLLGGITLLAGRLRRRTQRD